MNRQPLWPDMLMAGALILAYLWMLYDASKH